MMSNIMEHSVIFLIIVLLILVLVFQPRYLCLAIIVSIAGLLYYKYFICHGNKGDDEDEVYLPTSQTKNQGYKSSPTQCNSKSGTNRRETFVDRDMPMPKDPVVDRVYNYVVDRIEPQREVAVDEEFIIPPELDNSSSISDLIDNKKDLNDTMVAELLDQQKNFKRGLDRNNRNNVDAYSVWWRQELNDTDARAWFDDTNLSDAAQFFSDSIDKQDRVDSWIETGYTHLD